MKIIKNTNPETKSNNFEKAQVRQSANTKSQLTRNKSQKSVQRVLELSLLKCLERDIEKSVLGSLG